MPAPPRRLYILPCDESFESMERSSGGRRRCERCQCQVNDASALTQTELDGLLERAQTQRVCLRSELVDARPRLAAGLAAGLVAVVLAGCATPSSPAAVEHPQLSFAELVADGGELVEGEHQGVIAGVVKDRDGMPIENAIVVLQAVSLEGQRERMTNARGIYSFTDLPPGNYTIQVLAGRANVSKITQLPEGGRFRANFMLNPEQGVDVIVGMVVETRRVPMDASSTYHSSLVWIED